MTCSLNCHVTSRGHASCGHPFNSPFSTAPLHNRVVRLIKLIKTQIQRKQQAVQPTELGGLYLPQSNQCSVFTLELPCTLTVRPSGVKALGAKKLSTPECDENLLSSPLSCSCINHFHFLMELLGPFLPIQTFF